MHAEVKTVCVLGNRSEDTRRFYRLTLLQRGNKLPESKAALFSTYCVHGEGRIYDDGIVTAIAKLLDMIEIFDIIMYIN